MGHYTGESGLVRDLDRFEASTERSVATCVKVKFDHQNRIAGVDGQGIQTGTDRIQDGFRRLIPGVCHQHVELSCEVRHMLFDQREEQIVLAGEIRIECALRKAGAFADASNRGGCDPSCNDQPYRGVEQSCPRLHAHLGTLPAAWYRLRRRCRLIIHRHQMQPVGVKGNSHTGIATNISLDMLMTPAFNESRHP